MIRNTANVELCGMALPSCTRPYDQQNHIGLGTKNSLWRTAFLVALAMCLLGTLASAACAAGLSVSSLRLDGAVVGKVDDVLVRLPGATAGQRQAVDAGQTITPGTELTLPRGVQVELTTSNGNIITLHPGSRFLSGAVTDRGEAHQPLGGRIDFTVRKALDFFNIQYDRITAGVKGTAYTIEIEPAKSLKLSVTEGVVEVERQVRIKVAGDAERKEVESDAIRVAEDLKAGQSKTYQLNVAEYLVEFKNYGEAEAYFKKALTEAEASGDKRRILRAVQNLMEMYWAIGKPRAALELEGKCIGLAQGISDLAGEASCMSVVGLAYTDLSDYRKAIEYHGKSLAMWERIYAGRDHPNIATSLNNLGVAYYSLGEYRKAIEYYGKSLAMKERVFAGRDHPSIAASLNNLGVTYRSLGEYRKAIDCLEKSLEMRERIFAGRDHPDIAGSLNSLGVTYDSLGEYRKAIEYHGKSLAMRERIFAGRDHPRIAESLNNLGNAYHSLGEYRKAIEYHGKSLAMEERVYAGRDHPVIAGSLNNLGIAYVSLGEYRKAIEYHGKSLAMKERVYAGRDHSEIAVSLNNLGSAYAGLGEYRKAIEYHGKSLAMKERVYAGRDHPDIATSLNNLGAAYYSLGEYRKAIEYHAKSLAMMERVFAGRDHPTIVTYLRNLAASFKMSGNPQEAARYYERARAMFQRLKTK